MSDIKTSLENAITHINHESYNDALSSIHEAIELNKDLQATLDEANTRIEKLKADNDTQRRIREHICSSCGGAGFLGNAPDDYYDCPECEKSLAKVKADAVNDFACQVWSEMLIHYSEIKVMPLSMAQEYSISQGLEIK